FLVETKLLQVALLLRGRVGGEEGHALAVGTPAVPLDVSAVAENLARLAARQGHHVERLLSVLAATGEERDRFAVGRPPDRIDVDVGGDEGPRVPLRIDEVQLGPGRAVLLPR